MNKFIASGYEEGYGVMENIDVSLNYDNPDFMSSEFFDSVLSLENNMEDGFLSHFEDNINLSSDNSSHMDEVFSPESLNSESDKNSSCMDSLDDSIIKNIDSLVDPFLVSLLDTPEFKTEPSDEPVKLGTNVVPKQQTQILIQNPNNKKIIAKPILSANPQKPFKGKHQILKVHQISSNGGPVLLPLNMRSIKILKTTADCTTFTADFKKRKIQKSHDQTEINSNVVSSSSSYPPLTLTQEEKRLLAKEGVQLPTHHPLTKNEERELKRIRRKIRNKISAQDSRKRKKEYVDGLEERVKRGSEENKNLLQRVRALQRQNKTLMAHVNKLQALICNSTASKATPSTCLMVVLLSALFVSLPNMKLFENKQISTDQEQVAIRRSLLSSPQITEDSPLNMEEFLIFKDENKGKFEELFDIENSTEKEFNKILEEMEKEYDNFLSNNKNSRKNIFHKVFDAFKQFIVKDKPELFGNPDYGGSENIVKTKEFLEPEIDEDYSTNDGPPLKRSRFLPEENSNSIMKNEKIMLTTVNTQVHTKDK